MRKKKLGRTDIAVSELGIGCSHFSSISRPRSIDEVIQTVHAALDHGITLFDTADSYGRGESESILGKALADRRNKATVITKFGYTFGHQISGKKAQNLLFPSFKSWSKSIVKRSPLASKLLRSARKQLLTQNFSPEYTIKSVESSLKRLNTDYIDCYLAHSPPNPEKITEELIHVLTKLKTEGKIRCWGISVDHIDGLSETKYIQHAEVFQAPLKFSNGVNYRSDNIRIKSRKFGLIGREIYRDHQLINSILFKEVAKKHRWTDFELALYLNLEQELCDSLLIGTTTPANIESTIEYYDYYLDNRDEIINTLTSVDWLMA